ncbi:MAG: hypothetical protein FWD47_01095 [Treponema sp.]|nr:hypothetical protein [Treponema sp.]
MKKIVFLLIFVFITHVFTMYGEGNVKSSNELLLQISTLPEAKLGYIHSFNFPFLQGASPLTLDNGIDLIFTGEISPISLNVITEAVWTPIAFFQLSAGGRIGSGWNVELFGNEIFGIGLNKPDNAGKADGSAFDGLLWKMQLGGVFQFDLAAIFPGDWNHVVMRSYHEINYRGYTKAKKGESWFFEGDEGENINGFNYYGNFLIGYQMPIFLNLVGFLAEMDLYLYDIPNRGNWGDDLIRWTFSGIFSFEITEQFGVALLAQFRTKRNFIESNWESLYYRDRNINSSNPKSLEFYRIAAALTYRF